MRWLIGLAAIVLAAVAVWLFVPWRGAPPEITLAGDAARGEYLLRLGGCVSCHTDEKDGGAFLAGGRAERTITVRQVIGRVAIEEAGGEDLTRHLIEIPEHHGTPGQEETRTDGD